MASGILAFIKRGGLNAATWHYTNRGGERGLQLWAGQEKSASTYAESTDLYQLASASLRAGREITAQLSGAERVTASIPSVDDYFPSYPMAGVTNFHGRGAFNDEMGEILQHIDLNLSLQGDRDVSEIPAEALALIEQRVVEMAQGIIGPGPWWAVGFTGDDFERIKESLRIGITQAYYS